MHGQRNALEVWSGFGGLSIWKSFHFLLNWLYQFCPDLSENCFSYVFISGLLSGRKKYCGLWFFFFFFFQFICEYDSALCIFPFIVPPVRALRQFPLFVWVFKKEPRKCHSKPTIAGRLQTLPASDQPWLSFLHLHIIFPWPASSWGWWQSQVTGGKQGHPWCTQWGVTRSCLHAEAKHHPYRRPQTSNAQRYPRSQGHPHFVCQGGMVTRGLAELKWEQKLSLVLFFFYKKQM